VFANTNSRKLLLNFLKGIVLPFTIAHIPFIDMWTVPLLHRQRREVPAVRDGHAGEAEALASAFVVTLDVRLSKQRRQRTYQTRAVLFCPPPSLPPSCTLQRDGLEAEEEAEAEADAIQTKTRGTSTRTTTGCWRTRYAAAIS
jgi:hypothetical protein